MEETNGKYIRSGEFAKMNGVNKQTLFYYDKIHLFSPEFIDENGYRYYSIGQLDVFSTIQTLKTIGMSLDEIHKSIDSRNAENTLTLFRKCIQRTGRKIQELEQLVLEMQKRIELIEKTKIIGLGEIYIEHHERQHLYCTEYLPTDTRELIRYENLGKLIQYRIEHHLHCGHAVGGMVEKEFILHPDITHTKYCRYYSVIDYPDQASWNYEKPAGNYLVLYYKGPYEKTYQVYPQIVEYARRHHLELGDYSYEESLIDEVTEANVDNYITQITIPFNFQKET